MSSARARANHKLYLARLLISSWRQALEQQAVPASVLAQAFDGAVQDHLIQAYGWFLVEITDPQATPDCPPRGCVELAPPAEGKVWPGEIREFQQLEESGWIAQLLAAPDHLADVSRAGDNLAHQVGSTPELLTQWAQQLERLFERMSDSLEEY